MTTQDSHAPATKLDIQILMEWMGKHELKFEHIDRRFEHIDRRFEQIDQRFEQIDQRFEQIDQRFEQIDQRFEQVDRQFEELKQEMKKDKREILDYFQLAVETITTEIRGANRDEIEVVKDRVTRLERHTGLVR